ncbi:MAG: energy transducer TonB, partial [Bacteroidales bacterium]|nr:energy transducer TonB [Bacteroidales bacterium]
RVSLTFVVDVDGRVRDVQVMRGVDPALDREAVRAVSASPRWTPGRQRDKPVRVRYHFPVVFQLR